MATGESLPKKQKRAEASGHRGSFYNKYKYWRSEFKASGLWVPKNLTDEREQDDIDDLINNSGKDHSFYHAVLYITFGKKLSPLVKVTNIWYEKIF